MCKYIWMHACYAVHVEVKGQLGELILFFTMWVSDIEPKLSGLAACLLPTFLGKVSQYIAQQSITECLCECLRAGLSLWPSM